MGKKKKRLQMQKITEEKFVREALEDAVEFGLMERVGYDEHGEPLYRMPEDIEARLEQMKKTLGISYNFSK